MLHTVFGPSKLGSERTFGGAKKLRPLFKLRICIFLNEIVFIYFASNVSMSKEKKKTLKGDLGHGF